MDKTSGGKPYFYYTVDDVPFRGMSKEEIEKSLSSLMPNMSAIVPDIPIITGTTGEFESLGITPSGYIIDEIGTFCPKQFKEEMAKLPKSNTPNVSPIYPDKMYLVYYVVDGFINVNLFVTDNEFDACHYVDKANGVLERWKGYYLSLDGDHSNVLFDKVKLTNSIRGVYYKELEFRKF